MEIKKKFKNRKYVKAGLISLLLFILVLFLVFNWLGPLLSWDENVYLGNARSHIGGSNFTEDFRFPLLEWMVALIWLPGESILSAKIFVILLSLATIFFTYLILREYFPDKKAFLAVLCFGLSPLILLWGFKIYADVPSLFFIVISFYCLLKKEKLKLGAGTGRRGSVFIAIAGIAAALAFLTRFPLALFALSVGIYYLVKKEYKIVLIFSVFFVLALVPWLAYNQIHYQNPIWDLKETFTVVKEWTSWQPVIKQVKNLFGCMGILAFLIPVGFYSLLRNQNKDKNRKKLIWLVLGYTAVSFLYYFAFVKLKDMRYYLAFLPFLYLIAFDGFFWLNSKIKKKKVRKIIYLIVLINIVVMLCGTLFIQVKISDYEKDGAIIQSIDYLKEKNISSDSFVLSNIWPWYGYHLNVKTACLWSENLTELIDLYEPDYIIFDNHVGTYYNKTILDNDGRLKIEKEIKDKHNHAISIYGVV